MTFLLDRPTLDRLIESYEALRVRDGMGAMLHHVTPRQRVDAAQVCASVYAAGLVPAGDQRDFWLRYLRPILTETREQAALLAMALSGLSPPPRPPAVWWRRAVAVVRARASAGRRATAAIAAVAIVAAVAAYSFWSQQTKPEPPIFVTPSGPNLGAPSQPTSLLDGGTRVAAYAEMISLTMNVVDQYAGVVTPYALAATYAGAMPSLGQPAAILARMQRKVPLPPYAAIPRTPLGAMALRAYAAQAAAWRLGDATASFEPFLFDDARYAPQTAERVASFAKSGSRPAVAPPPAWETWPWWTMLLPFLILVPGVVWAFSGRDELRRETVEARLRESGQARRAAQRSRAGDRGTRRILQTSIGRPPPLPLAGSTMRALATLREPIAGLRLDANRSLRATLASGGDLVTVMRPASRAIHFVFLVRRDCPHDHQRARALRLVNALSDAGVAVTAYDYAQDPRALTATSRSVAGERTAPRTFDLRGLRELHAGSVLVLVTDGDDLYDCIAQKPFPVVREELRRWPRRMLLTPVPVAEWGEREMRLAFALDAPIGRMTMAGLADLRLGLTPDAPEGRPRRALQMARIETGFFARIARWSAAAASAITPDPMPERPPALSGAGVVLLLHASPSKEEQEELLAATRAWLGPAFFWFAACGVYPQLRFDLTLWLGRRLRRYGHPRNAEIFSEAALERLCLLPWMRNGFMPDWLRVAAFEALSTREQAMARTAIAEILDGLVDEAERSPAGLAVWQADWHGQALAADDVMLELVDPQNEAPVDRDALAADAVFDAGRRWRNRGLWRMALLSGWAALTLWFWPAPAAAPHPQGAWWPLLAFVASSGLLSATVVAPRTRKYWERVPPAIVRAEKRIRGWLPKAGGAPAASV
ncbi:hypothetical protein LPLAFNJD_LOCUS2334 [Methylorubrum aminovorans]